MDLFWKIVALIQKYAANYKIWKNFYFTKIWIFFLDVWYVNLKIKNKKNSEHTTLDLCSVSYHSPQ